MSFTWNIPAAANASIGTNVADDILVALASAVTTNSGGGSASWEIAGTSVVSPRYVILKRKSGAAGRIIFFGQQGSTANAAAVRGTPAANALYIGYSATSTSNTADASYLSGAPLAASDYIPGVVVWLVTLTSLTYRVNYAEFADGFYLLLSQVANGFGIAGAGEILQNTSGTAVSAIQGTGANIGTTWQTSTSNNSSIFPPSPGLDNSYTTAASAVVARVSGSNQMLYRPFSVAAAATVDKFYDSANTESFFYPVPLVYNTTDASKNVFGKVRQIGFGPKCNRETTLIDTATGLVGAYGHAYETAGSTGHGVWFVNADL